MSTKLICDCPLKDRSDHRSTLANSWTIVSGSAISKQNLLSAAQNLDMCVWWALAGSAVFYSCAISGWASSMQSMQSSVVLLYRRASLRQCRMCSLLCGKAVLHCVSVVCVLFMAGLAVLLCGSIVCTLYSSTACRQHSLVVTQQPRALLA